MDMFTQLHACQMGNSKTNRFGPFETVIAKGLQLTLTQIEQNDLVFTNTFLYNILSIIDGDDAK
jgi:hypothetical protein